MTKASLDLIRKNNEEKVNNDYELKQRDLLFLTKIKKLTVNEEKLIAIFDELKFTCNLFDTKKIIFNFKHITDLTLKYISLEILPSDIKNLYNLTCLDLSGNKLTYLPKSLALLQRLLWLNLSNNEFRETPHVLYFGLRFLKILDLSHNAITEFNEPPECINSILQFRMSNNALNEIPAWIFNTPCHLEILDLSLNTIKHETQISRNPLGPGIYNCLRILNIENCNFICQKLHYLKYFKNLEILHLGNKNYIKNNNKNFLGTLTMDPFKKVKRLKCLYMENNDIVMLPQEFGQLQCIQYLNLSENMLSWLPDSFCDLINLEVIFLSSNQLIFLPENIDNLVNLQQIHLNNNKLHKLPAGFCKLHNLRFIDLYDNEITKIDSINFNSKMLNGIDLELNFLDLDMLEWLDFTKKRYSNLKTCFRKQFNISSRYDLQKINKTADLEKIIVSSSDNKLDITDFEEEEEEEERGKEFPTFFDETEKNIVEESETWEGISCENDNHDFFEPRYSAWGEDKFFNCPSVMFKNCNKNYCPADYHPSSLLNFCCKNFSLYNEVIEEQFDSE